MSMRGFSLLEVLVALAAVALVLGVALPQTRLTLASARQAERQSLALLVAESKISEVALRPILAAAEETGEAEAGLLWRLEVSPATEHGDTPRLRLWQVSVEVRDRSGETRLRLASLRLGEVAP